MASQWPPLKNTAFSFEIGLYSQADSTALKSGPTLAAGDFKISIDGSAPVSITNTPTASGTVVTIALTAAEMNGDRIHIVWQDAAGAEWISSFVMFYTVARLHNDLAFPATSGRSLLVDANGRIDVGSWLGTAVTLTSGVPDVNIKTITAAIIAAASFAANALDAVWATAARTITGGTIGTYTGNTPQTGDAFARLGAPAGASHAADVAAVKAVLPAALVAGRMDSSIGAVQNSAMTAAGFAPSAIDAAALATDAGQEIADRILARRINGGADGSPTVFAMLAAMGMDFTVVAGVLSVISPVDGVTVVYTRTLSRTAGLDAITGSA